MWQSRYEKNKSIPEPKLLVMLIYLLHTKLQNTFSSFYAPTVQKMAICEIENQQLSNLRDWLLPMLMNGQVTVGKAYEQVEEVLGIVAEDEVIYNNPIKATN